MRHFYGVDNVNFDGIAGDGSGQTIAIVDALDDPNAASDLHQFDSYYGLPDPPSFEVLDEYGGNNLPTNDGPGPISWEVEESLDVQWAHVTAPAASIVLIEANSASLDDLLQGVQTAAALPNVVAVSMSWGGQEGPDHQRDVVRLFLHLEFGCNVRSGHRRRRFPRRLSRLLSQRPGRRRNHDLIRPCHH